MKADTSLTSTACKISSQLRMFHDGFSDSEIIQNKAENIVKLVENIESFSIDCREKLVYYDAIFDTFRYAYNNNNKSTSLQFDKKYLPTMNKNINIYTSDNYLQINMFPLIKNVSSKTKRYIFHCLSEAIKNHLKNNPKPIFNDKATVVFLNKRETARVLSDNDNVEISAVIDTRPILFT